jgi:hypothetical protein
VEAFWKEKKVDELKCFLFRAKGRSSFTGYADFFFQQIELVVHWIGFYKTGLVFRADDWVGFLEDVDRSIVVVFQGLETVFKRIDWMVFKGLDDLSGCWGSSGGFSLDWQRFSKDLGCFFRLTGSSRIICSDKRGTINSYIY